MSCAMNDHSYIDIDIDLFEDAKAGIATATICSLRWTLGNSRNGFEEEMGDGRWEDAVESRSLTVDVARAFSGLQVKLGKGGRAGAKAGTT
jgi:hypothetical protein